jgi:hypothetical protein
MTDFNSYTTHFGHHCSGKDNLVTGGSNWPLIGFTYTSCFRLGSRTNRFQGDADLLQTCKMGLERGNSTFTSLSIVGNHTQGWQQCDN